MNKTCAIGVPPWSEFCRKAKLPVPDSISNTAPSYALGCKTTSSLIYWKVKDIWLSVMSIFPEPVYGNGIIAVSYIAKHICRRDVIVPRCELRSIIYIL